MAKQNWEFFTSNGKLIKRTILIVTHLLHIATQLTGLFGSVFNLASLLSLKLKNKINKQINKQINVNWVAVYYSD